jgi:hypothetical protein
MRFALSSIGRLVLPFSAHVRLGGVRDIDLASQQPSIERLHVEWAHAFIHPVHLPMADARRRASFVNTVRDIHTRTS